MNFFPEPVNPSEKTSKNHLIVNSNEANKNNKEQGFFDKGFADKSLIVSSSILTILNTMVKQLLVYQKKKARQEPSYNLALEQNLMNLKILFQTLQLENQSNNPLFYQKFSKFWCSIDAELQLMSNQKNWNTNKKNVLDKLILDISQYPKNEDHNLGFYLAHRSGIEWLPVPYSDIINQLYSNNKTSSDQSTLNIWINLITEFLQG